MQSSWNHGKTCTIRVPVSLKRRVIKAARHLDEGNEIVLSNKVVEFSSNKNSENILSQDRINEAIAILKHGITPRKQGGAYVSSNANSLKQEVLKALAILEDSK